MLSRIWGINLILAVLIGILWISIWNIRHTEENPIPDISVSSEADATPQKSRDAEKKPPEASVYDTIVEKNLFSPDRVAGIADQISSPAAEDLRISGEKIMLFGVILMDDYKAAMINNPAKESDGKEYRWVREGERIGNLKVVDIQKDQISLNDGALQYKISLFDPNKVKNKDKTGPSREEPKVISSGAGQPESAQVQATKPQAGTSTPETNAAAQKREEPKIVGADTASESQKTQAPQPKEKGKISADGQYEIIDTPFGTMERKIKK